MIQKYVRFSVDELRFLKRAAAQCCYPRHLFLKRLLLTSSIPPNVPGPNLLLSHLLVFLSDLVDQTIPITCFSGPTFLEQAASLKSLLQEPSPLPIRPPQAYAPKIKTVKFRFKDSEWEALTCSSTRGPFARWVRLRLLRHRPLSFIQPVVPEDLYAFRARLLRLQASARHGHTQKITGHLEALSHMIQHIYVSLAGSHDSKS